MAGGDAMLTGQTVVGNDARGKLGGIAPISSAIEHVPWSMARRDWSTLSSGLDWEVVRPTCPKVRTQNTASATLEPCFLFGARLGLLIVRCPL